MVRKRPSLAKISRPRLFGVVPRERLFAILDSNRGRPLIWVSGPPGAGKTALVASYLEDRGTPTIWYQIDAGDGDPAALFRYLALAVDSLVRAGPVALPEFFPEHLSDLPSFARLFFRALFARLPERSVLVLDNYQDVSQGDLLHEIVHQAIAEVPPDYSVIGISRVDPPRSFAQLAARGALVAVGWDQLQLTLDEVCAIAAKRGVSDDWILQALHRQSQGWAAGITLMLERLGHFDGKPGELPTDTRESVFNYFASLILDQASEATRHILLSIAFLPRVTPALARELSGRTEAPALLEELYRRRMFLDRRPGVEPVYQFHALFLDFLRARAKEVFASGDFGELLFRSATALESVAEFDAATGLWLETQNWGEATRLILEEAGNLLNDGRRHTLVRWIQAIPESRRSEQPWLVCWLGRAQMQVSPSDGIDTLEIALDLFRRSDDLRGRVECLTDLIAGAFVGFEAVGKIDRWLDELLAQIDLSPDSLSANVSLRSWGVLCMALFHVRPWHPLTEPAFQQVGTLLPQCTDASVVLGTATGALIVSQLGGKFEEGDRIALVAEAFASPDSASPSQAAWWFAQVGYLRYVEARYEEALDYFAKARRIAEANGLRTLLEVVVFWRFMVEYRIVGWPAAGATLAKLEAMPRSTQPMRVAMHFLFKARQAMHHGQSQEAAIFAASSDQAVLRMGSCFEAMLFGLCNADILIAARCTREATPLLSRARALIQRSPAYGCWRAASLFLEAWEAESENDRVPARDLLAQSLSLARQGNQRYYLRFLERSLAPLFRLALDERIEVDLVEDLIRLFRIRPPMDAPDNWPWPVRILTLGRFEVQIGGQKLEFSKKLPRKTLLLLKAIIALGGRDVPEQVLCDALWGDEDGDAAQNALGITVLRLRKLLGTSESVLQQGGKLSLNAELCWVDAWRLEARLAGRVDLQALDLYGGAFLPEDQGESWSVAARERLRGKFIHALSSHGAALESGGDPDDALQCFLRGIDADPIVEAFHQGLMRCYERLGRRTEALSAYRRLKQILSVLLGVPPSDATQELFRELLQRQAEGGHCGDSDGRAVTDDSAAAADSNASHRVVIALRGGRKPGRR